MLKQSIDASAHMEGDSQLEQLFSVEREYDKYFLVEEINLKYVKILL